MRTHDARRLALRLMVANGLGSWAFQYDKAKRRFGVCRYDAKVIGLSLYLVRMNDEAKVRDVILHEIAHAIAGHRAKHGPQWRQVCLRIGARPVRCYGAEVNKPKPNWTAVCDACGHKVTRLRIPPRIRNESSCSQHGTRGYNERFKLKWRRV